MGDVVHPDRSLVAGTTRIVRTHLLAPRSCHRGDPEISQPHHQIPLHLPYNHPATPPYNHPTTCPTTSLHLPYNHPFNLHTAFLYIVTPVGLIGLLCAASYSTEVYMYLYFASVSEQSSLKLRSEYWCYKLLSAEHRILNHQAVQQCNVE